MFAISFSNVEINTAATFLSNVLERLDGGIQLHFCAQEVFYTYLRVAPSIRAKFAAVVYMNDVSGMALLGTDEMENFLRVPQHNRVVVTDHPENDMLKACTTLVTFGQHDPAWPPKDWEKALLNHRHLIAIHGLGGFIDKDDFKKIASDYVHCVDELNFDNVSWEFDEFTKELALYL